MLCTTANLACNMYFHVSSFVFLLLLSLCHDILSLIGILLYIDYVYKYTHIYIYLYIVAKTRKFGENKVLNIVNVEL